MNAGKALVWDTCSAIAMVLAFALALRREGIGNAELLIAALLGFFSSQLYRLQDEVKSLRQALGDKANR